MTALPCPSPFISQRAIDSIIVPALLDGSQGTNRAHGRTLQINARNDLEAIEEWLYAVASNENTHRAYKKEAHRLLRWSIVILGKPLSSLTGTDIRAYLDFASNPPIDWCEQPAPKGQPKIWRPFKKALTTAGRAQATLILKGMFNFLVSVNYLDGNPVATQRERKVVTGTKAISKQRRHALSNHAVQFIKQAISALPTDTRRANERKERMTLMFRLLYETGLRRFEAAKIRMCDFSTVNGNWWLTVIGKGDKDSDVAISNGLYETVVTYRNSTKNPSMPTPRDTTPLFLHLGGQKGITDTMLYLEVRELLRQASHLSHVAGDTASASALNLASTHWLRHTSLTHLADNTNDDMRIVKMHGRHGKIETTLGYLSNDSDQAHSTITTALDLDKVA